MLCLHRWWVSRLDVSLFSDTPSAGCVHTPCSDSTWRYLTSNRLMLATIFCRCNIPLDRDGSEAETQWASPAIKIKSINLFCNDRMVSYHYVIASVVYYQ